MLKHFPGASNKKTYHVQITLITGKVIFCTVRDQTDHILDSGESALLKLTKMGQLSWSWSATETSIYAYGGTILASVVAPGQQAASPITDALQKVPITDALPKLPARNIPILPRRIVPLEKIDRNKFSRKHWQVLLLVNGMRTVAQIATLLIPTPSLTNIQEISSILNDLHRRGIIIAKQE